MEQSATEFCGFYRILKNRPKWCKEETVKKKVQKTYKHVYLGE